MAMAEKYLFCFVHLHFEDSTLYQHVIIPASQTELLISSYTNEYSLRVVQKEPIADFSLANEIYKRLLWDGETLLKSLVLKRRQVNAGKTDKGKSFRQ